ncbi:histidinol-phosphatase (PHP family) [Neolewinella xylanilytica]|uniref:Histidinol-phosphatase n=1 Tax=Neolewinella xylanilytica TaxID=1514080 RepID=A0A2S6I282_9BACT|nr:histidinol-phosphatase [Neolewinella xylanilytica]PPK85292.1 histidinol-phosphatase (PHP family) [Neolewinella xylanilytica]
MLTNHHAHTYYSDGVGAPEEYVERALREGFTSYGFSDHAPIPFAGISSMSVTDLSDYIAEIDRLRLRFGDRIKLYKSLEVDYIPEVINVDSTHIRAAGLDYTVGAVHYIDYLPDGMPWSFQRANPVFEEGINTIFGGNPRAMVERYFSLVREMVATHPPSIVAHLDRVKKRNQEGRYWDENEPWYRRAVEETLEAIAGAGCIMEVNTRGIYLDEITDTYPTDWVVRRAHQRGIRLQVNSDAHRSEHIAGAFQEVYEGLRAMDVEIVWTFTGQEFTPLEVADLQPLLEGSPDQIA